MKMSRCLTFLVLWIISLAEGVRRLNETYPTNERLSWVISRLSIEDAAVRSFPGRVDELPKVSSCCGKVAFLFLTMKDLEFPELWEAFFQDAPRERYSIYVHRAALKDEDRLSEAVPLKAFGARDVPWVPTAWCALFAVEVASLFAAMQDPDNLQFVFVSDSSVPLKPFSYVYEELVVKSPQTSKICLASPASSTSAYAELAKQELTRGCVFRDFLRHVNPRSLKHHQWAIFNRAHAKQIIKYAEAALDIYRDAWMEAAPDIKHSAEGCSDEAVPLIALLHGLQIEEKSTGNTWMDLTRLGVEQNCLTYVRWRNCFGGTSLSLQDLQADLGSLWRNWHEVSEILQGDQGAIQKSQLKRELNGFPANFQSMSRSYLQEMVDQGFMFARKFSKDIQITDSRGRGQPLVEVLPELWAGVEASKARLATWTRLDYSGRPGALIQ